ncbi:hypothetical protein MKW92_020082 [Papaver armeniacum]|nr:hypothetical protein MKW92_020082 [Papaver armeniacum]
MKYIRNELHRNDDDRAMILRFGHVDRFLTHQDIKDYFSLNFGANCVKSIKLHCQVSYHYQALVVFAEVFFHSMATVESVLRGQTCVLLVINGLRSTANAYIRRPRTIDAIASGSPAYAPATPGNSE